MIANKLAEEYKLLKIDPSLLLAQMEKIINPPPIDEAEAKKKPQGKKIEEPQENIEEMKEIKEVAMKVKEYRELNAIDTLETPETYIAELIAIKIKYSFPIKSEDQLEQDLWL